MHVAIVLSDKQARQPFWRNCTPQEDTVIKSNCKARFIPSVLTITVEVLRHRQAINVEEHGTSVSRERWMDHTIVPNMVRGYVMMFGGTILEKRREVYCPVCL